MVTRGLLEWARTRPSSVLACSSIAVVVIGVGSSAAVTRLYSPESIGFLSLFVSLIALAAPYATLRLATAIPIVRHPQVALQLGLACMSVAVAAGVVTGVVAIGLAGFWYPVGDRGSTWSVLLVIPAVVGVGFSETLINWSLRTGAFRSIAVSRVQQSVVGSVLKIAFGAIGAGPIGLQAAHAIGLCVGWGGMLKQFWRELLVARHRLGARSVLKAAMCHRSFVALRLPAQMLLSLGTQAPILLTGHYYGLVDAGQLAMAIGTMATTSGVVVLSVTQAHYSKCAQIGRNDRDRLIAESRRVLWLMLAIAALPCLVVWFAGPSIFRIYLGPEWSAAGVLASSLAPAVLTQSAAAPLMTGLAIVRANWMFALLNALRVGVVAAVFACGLTQRWGIERTVQVLGVALTGYFIVCIAVVFSAIHRGRWVVSRGREAQHQSDSRDLCG